MRKLIPALALLSAAACVPYYHYPDGYYYGAYGAPHPGAYKDKHHGDHRRVTAVDDVHFARVDGPGVFEVIVRGRTLSRGWHDPELEVVRVPGRPGELTLALVAVPPDGEFYGPRTAYPGDYYRGPYRDGIYPASGVYAHDGHEGDVVVARFRIDPSWNGRVVRVISDTNEIAADIRDPRYGYGRYR